MNKLPYILALLLAGFAVLLAPASQFSGQHPKSFNARSDARVTEYMAGAGPEALTGGQRKAILEKFGGLPGQLQRHRIVTPFLLKLMPGNDWPMKWIQLAVLCTFLIAGAAWYIGNHIGGHWKYGALCTALALATAGWQIGRIPWHKDTVVTALEWLIIAALVRRCYWAVGILLMIGVLTKESFVFLAVGVAGYMLIVNWRTACSNSSR